MDFYFNLGIYGLPRAFKINYKDFLKILQYSIYELNITVSQDFIEIMYFTKQELLFGTPTKNIIKVLKTAA